MIMSISTGFLHELTTLWKRWHFIEKICYFHFGCNFDHKKKEMALSIPNLSKSFLKCVKGCIIPR